MIAPDRATREQVDAALELVDLGKYVERDSGAVIRLDTAEVLAVAVRALLAEIEPYRRLAPQTCAAGLHGDWLVDSEHHYPCPWCQVHRLRAALVARTPQPAEQAAPRDAEFWRLVQAGYSYQEAQRRSMLTAPLPAVPDGEDEPRLHKVGEVLSDCSCCAVSADVCAGVSGCCEQCAEIGRLNMHATTTPRPELFTDPPKRRAPRLDGEDVPTRLDAAAALAALTAQRDAVLALHRDAGPGMGHDTPSGDYYGDFPTSCTTCGTSDEYAVAWPCPTARALGVDDA